MITLPAKPKAFTLVELIIVIVVLGILAAIAIAGYTAVVRRSNIASVEQSALSFNRQLITMSAQSAGSLDDLGGGDYDKMKRSSRNSTVVFEALSAGDGPRGVTIHASKGGGLSSPLGTPVKIWNGSTVTVADANAFGSPLLYLQFVKNGAGVCLRLSLTGSQATDMTVGGTPTGKAINPDNISDAFLAGAEGGAGWIIMKRVASGASATSSAANTNPCDSVDDYNEYTVNDW